MAGTLITGLLIASPAAAQGSTPADPAAGSVKSAPVKPVPPNSANSKTSKVAKTPAKGLSGHEKRQHQKVVRAVVREDASLVRGQSFGAASSSRVSSLIGTYQVCFKVPVTNGTYTASIGLPGNSGDSDPGEITVVGRADTRNCLFIQTYNSAGALADRGFHVVVAYSHDRRR
ncbi:hypothetical protein G4Z16_17205 [Streptomyces bathyalis]|uniref:Uncharacterized protein n=1 Tax=Streptomyces bathyalis TaxID=2710756 RepID=A0A7T1T7K5_9ACTN|nr:hypothetical protein [Streptomyces bathyalis]QPP07851.1 hypothetical protein G4Z16_17205 [Streptomyces bathyalis]